MIRRFPIDRRRPWPVGETIRRAVPRVHGLPLVHVLHVREQQLRTVSHKDALNEGFQGNRARMAFQLDWVRRHDSWSRRHPWASDAQLMERWRQHHANTVVLVVTFELVRIERERFLAPQRPLKGYMTTGGNGQYAPMSSVVDRLPIAAINEDDVREARQAGAQARSRHTQARQDEAARAKADRGRLQRLRRSG
jgi:hypothetical protein